MVQSHEAVEAAVEATLQILTEQRCHRPGRGSMEMLFGVDNSSR